MRPNTPPTVVDADMLIDPLLIAAVTKTPITRHHYHHLNRWHTAQSDIDDSIASTPALSPAASSRELSPSPAVQVKCMARTRIPTPHGPAFLHLYHNTRDSKEHLAIVVDPAQLDGRYDDAIRSKSLDAVWSETESDADRLLRGAYTGTLTPSQATPSRPFTSSSPLSPEKAPLVRIHSECFTGETIGSLRCDCGEQLDAALRTMASERRGAVIYLRQEGRGIGLLSKIRAYNLQDMGHDTVSANLALGHGADERGYEVAAAILQDLGLTNRGEGSGVRLLTNNPDKVRALEREGIPVAERVPMVPRSWQCGDEVEHGHDAAHHVPGATLIGGDAVRSPELDKYLRTKVMRMGHILHVPEQPPSIR